jgi:hypothetical protein
MASRIREEHHMEALVADAHGCLSLGSRFANAAFIVRERRGKFILACEPEAKVGLEDVERRWMRAGVDSLGSDLASSLRG